MQTEHWISPSQWTLLEELNEVLIAFSDLTAMAEIRCRVWKDLCFAWVDVVCVVVVCVLLCVLPAGCVH